MIIDIFIRTYEKDLRWLDYALASIEKYVTGYRNIIVAIPNKEHLNHLTKEIVVQVQDMKDGYVGQQYTKLEAWRYTDADVICYWDSDCIAYEPFDVRSQVVDGKIILLRAEYSKIVPPALGGIWKPIVEKITKIRCDWEYMRRVPLFFYGSTARLTYEYLERIHKKSLYKYMNSVAYRTFSEFNVMGVCAENFDADKYLFIDVYSDSFEVMPIKQFWSWSGLTEDESNEIKNILK
jgi:hypothetical protein